jgi:hypothetical protein
MIGKLRKPIPQEELKRLYIDEKKSSVYIGKIYKVSPDTVLRQVTRLGFNTREAGLPSKGNVLTKKILYDLYITQNKSPEEIGKIYECSHTTVLLWISKYGISIKKRGYPKGRKNILVAGDLSPTKRTAVRAKMSKNHAPCSGKDNGMYGKGHLLKGIKNGMYNKQHTEATIYKIKTYTVSHHIYLRDHSDETMELDRGKHSKLHREAYRYLMEVFGKEGINNYLKWFDKRYGLK